MADKEFTESAYRAAKGGASWGKNYIRDFVTEYGDEVLLNLYPQAVNLTAAAVETLAGVANKPVNLGRYPYYNLQTQFDKTQSEANASPNAQATIPAPTGSNTKFIPLNEPVGKTINNKLNYVVKTYGENPTAEVFTDKEKARAALKGLYAKNQKATMSNVPADKAKEFTASSIVDKVAKNKEAIRKLRNPQTEEEILQVAENRGRMEEGIAKANEEKRVKDKAEGAKFADWRSGVDIRRRSEDALNQFNNEMGMLKSAYRDAKQSGKPLEAIELSREIRKRQGSIPKEIGARKKYFEENAVRNRDAMLSEMKRIEQEREAVDRLASVNSDARDYIPRFNINNTAPIRLTY